MTSSQNPLQLRHLSNLVTDQTVNFGQFQRVDNVNYLDAVITGLKGDPLSILYKRFKANQFCFFNITHERFIIGCAVVNLKSLSNCFVYVYDKKTNELIEVNRVSPLAVGTKLSTTPNNGTIQFQQGNLKLHADFTDACIKLKLSYTPKKSKPKQPKPSKKKTNHTTKKSHEDTAIQLTALITPSSSPMCLCTRNSYEGWVYMQKQTALSCRGSLTIDDKCHVLSQNNCLAGIDWTLGYMAKQTFWNWSSISANIKDDSNHARRLGLNLVCGVNDTSYTENAVWLDGALYNLPLSVFDYNSADLMRPWHIYSNSQIPTDRRVDLRFTPVQTRSDHTDIKAITSHFSQLIGQYSGTIELPTETIKLNNVWGLAEDHYAKW